MCPSVPSEVTTTRKLFVADIASRLNEGVSKRPKLGSRLPLLTDLLATARDFPEVRCGCAFGIFERLLFDEGVEEGTGDSAESRGELSVRIWKRGEENLDGYSEGSL